MDLTTTPSDSYAAVLDSPIGPLRVVVQDEKVTAVHFHPFDDLAAAEGTTPVLDAALRQLREYFAGERTVFDVPLGAVGTAYQHRVWAVLNEIPHGTTVSYAEVARRLGQEPGASRAVGTACGRNPVPVIVPCHRVVASSGALTGYAGGVERKATLLALERHDVTAG
ncbi:methylated-DNA--[protein]-cysteine S-methyltransferase [Nocardioides yefusunii]|uniref:Methylated-DNA--protein-cysteine methyltransferase n=1 Tax=Nocardioides yefusunii TaxID=2500546 RepID=A0ABW1QWY6_9ACTN|nr:methylated-DNA--[protein]-cysteine S-methyltransferase [Nocardioides yefusunii]